MLNQSHYQSNLLQAALYAPGSLKINRLHAIDGPKEPFHRGSYGECEDCGRDIDYSRLVVCPTATKCAVCQTAYEGVNSTKRYMTL